MAGWFTMTLNYIGPSMNPTLRVGDLLRVVPCENAKMRVGDVVVFVPPEGKRNVVHRVISVDSRSIRTRGDNNSRTDPWVLQPDEIIGRVTAILRENRAVKIHGGTAGRVVAAGCRVRKRAGRRIVRTLHPGYDWLARTGIFRKILPGLVKPQIVYYRRPNGTAAQLHLGQHVIGRRLPGRDHWHIRRPFRLFVDEVSLTERPRGS